MAQSYFEADEVARLKADAERRVGELTDRARAEASNMAERGREMSEQAQEAAQTMVQDRPLLTIAVAAVVGFALGALWKS